MDFLDLLSLIIDNLSRRKARVALTAFGVVIGTASLVLLVSLAIGLQLNATKQLTGIGDLTRIDVYPTYGEPAESMAVKVGGSGAPQQQNLLTNSAIEEIRSLPGVVAVIPRDYLYGSAIMKYNRLENWVNLIGVDSGDVSYVGVEPQAGVNTLQKGTAIIGSMVTTGFYDPNWRPGREQPAPPDLLDQTVKLYIIKYNPDDGSEIRKSYQVRIAGILPETRGESDWSVYMNLDDIEKYNEWITGNKINRNKEGYSQVMVKVDNVKNVLDVTEQITELGYQAFTPQSFVEGINK